MNSSWETIPEKLEDVAIKLRKYLLESEYLQDDQLLVYQLIRSELNAVKQQLQTREFPDFISEKNYLTNFHKYLSSAKLDIGLIYKMAQRLEEQYNIKPKIKVYEPASQLRIEEGDYLNKSNQWKDYLITLVEQFMATMCTYKEQFQELSQLLQTSISNLTSDSEQNKSQLCLTKGYLMLEKDDYDMIMGSMTPTSKDPYNFTKQFQYLSKKKQYIDAVLQFALNQSENNEELFKQVQQIIKAYTEIIQTSTFQFFLNSVQLNQDLLKILGVFCSEMDIFESEMKLSNKQLINAADELFTDRNQETQLLSQTFSSHALNAEQLSQSFNGLQYKTTRSVSAMMDKILNQKISKAKINRSQTHIFQSRKSKELENLDSDILDEDNHCCQTCLIF